MLLCFDISGAESENSFFMLFQAKSFHFILLLIYLHQDYRPTITAVEQMCDKIFFVPSPRKEESAPLPMQEIHT